MTKSKRFSQIFWLSFLFASLAYAWYSFYVPSNDIEWAEDMNKAELLAESTDKNLMLFFTGTWCVPCKVMKRQVFADKQSCVFNPRYLLRIRPSSGKQGSQNPGRC